MTLLLIMLGGIVVALVLNLWVAAHAPMGFEDETGFHFGRQVETRGRIAAGHPG